VTTQYSLDLLSKSNPVYLSLFVVAICQGHKEHSGRPIEIPSIYLALLSGKVNNEIVFSMSSCISPTFGD